jgi:hypothetical protein
MCSTSRSTRAAQQQATRVHPSRGRAVLRSGRMGAGAGALGLIQRVLSGRARVLVEHADSAIPLEGPVTKYRLSPYCVVSWLAQNQGAVLEGRISSCRLTRSMQRSPVRRMPHYARAIWVKVAVKLILSDAHQLRSLFFTLLVQCHNSRFYRHVLTTMALVYNQCTLSEKQKTSRIT